MNAHTKNKAKLAALTAAVFLAAAAIMPHHYAMAESAAKITVDGRPSSQSRLYKWREDELTLHIGEPDEWAAYIINTRRDKIDYVRANKYGFFFGAAFVQDKNASIIDLEYEPKSGVEPRIVRGARSIEFTSLHKRRVRVAW